MEMLEVEATVPDGYSWFFIQNTNDEIDELLYEELAYFVENAERTTAYKRGNWDGYERLYHKGHHGAPIGLIERSNSILQEYGYTLNVTWEGHREGDPVQFDWEFEHDLRDYQNEAINAVIDNGGGIVGLPTGTGKTITALRLAKEVGMQSGKPIVMVHSKELLSQWAEVVRETLNVEPGVIGDGKWSEGPITIAIMQTLISRGPDQLDGDYGLMIFDECHRTSAAETMHEIGMEIDVDMRVGLSATPWRRVDGEELKIEAAVGGEVYTATAEEMIDQGYLAKPDFEILEHDGNESDYNGDYHQEYKLNISTDLRRNLEIAQRAQQLAADGHKVLIDVSRVLHGELLEYLLNDDVEADFDRASDRRVQNNIEQHKKSISKYTKNAVFLSGSDGNERRQEVLDEFENGDIDIVVSTLLGEGVDIPNISAIIIADAMKSDIATIQTIGRALRPANGDSAKIVNVKDYGGFFNQSFDVRQETMANYYGKYFE